MKRSTISATFAALVLVAGLTGGCNTPNEAMRAKALESAEKTRKGPQSPVVKNITNFTPALRCMDENLMMYGIRDLVVITEDIDDKTFKVAAGAKDMLISAVSQMTQRSRAISLIAYGKDSNNLISFMTQREEKGLYQLKPLYSIRGSISQFDENVAKETAGGGVVWGNSSYSGGIGATNTAGASMLGLDLTMVHTENLTIVPGVTSNNTVAIIRSGGGASMDATIRKFGLDFEMSFGQSEGSAQALRNLIDLATIELFGKLTKTPYWTCLGGSASSQTVKNEIDNWYYSLSVNQETLVAYWQNQMRLRGLYRKEVNGIPDEDLSKAVEIYREALGLEKSAKLDQQFFAVYLNANHYRVQEKVQKILAARDAAGTRAVSQPTQKPQPALQIKGQIVGKMRKAVGEAVQKEQEAKKEQSTQKTQPAPASETTKGGKES